MRCINSLQKEKFYLENKIAFLKKRKRDSENRQKMTYFRMIMLSGMGEFLGIKTELSQNEKYKIGGIYHSQKMPFVKVSILLGALKYVFEKIKNESARESIIENFILKNPKQKFESDIEKIVFSVTLYISNLLKSESNYSYFHKIGDEIFSNQQQKKDGKQK